MEKKGKMLFWSKLQTLPIYSTSNSNKVTSVNIWLRNNQLSPRPRISHTLGCHGNVIFPRSWCYSGRKSASRPDHQVWWGRNNSETWVYKGHSGVLLFIVSYRNISYLYRFLWHSVSYRIAIVPYFIVSYHIVSFCIVSYRIVSFRIVSYRTISYLIISYRVVWYGIVSYRITSYGIVWYRMVSYGIISYHMVSYLIISYLSYLIVSYRLIS